MGDGTPISVRLVKRSRLIARTCPHVRFGRSFSDYGELREWVTSAPDIPDDLPQFVSTYAVEMAMPQLDMASSVWAVLRHALLDTDDESDAVPIILDIEMIMYGPLDPVALWTEVEELHNRENLIFERTITERVRDLIK